MHRVTRRGLIIALALAGLAGTAALAIVAALRSVPADYEAALRLGAARAAKASDEFLQEAAGVASDVRRPGAWDAVFTVEQINGWLAVDVPENFPDLLPPGVNEPRVFIHPGDLTIACRYRNGAIDTVLSLGCDVYLQSPNVLAIRIKSARAGLAPLPLSKVLEVISHTAQELELPLEWRRSGGDPVALVNVVPPHARSRGPIELDSVELHEGELAVAGRTGRAGAVAMAKRLSRRDTSPTGDAADPRSAAPAQAPSAAENAPIVVGPGDDAQRGLDPVVAPATNQPSAAPATNQPSAQPSAAAPDSPPVGANDTLQR
jgi:hypothetical protein